MAAGYGDKVTWHEHPVGLLGYAVNDVRHGFPVHGVEWRVVARVGHRLEGDAAHHRMLDAEANDVADLVVIHTISPLLSERSRLGSGIGVGSLTFIDFAE